MILDDFGTERVWCPDCGRAHEYVRPGKTQPTCDCHERCPVHGPNMVVYHPPGEYGRTSGYFCAECMASSASLHMSAATVRQGAARRRKY